ncbi:hypothetical protein [uncultured Algibacter sp.]|uniref:hypothetical protein n=1 Tax=uncultured Algibacter sp. TaxID=298659 RepID=UPI0026050E48|nr:hypothetical protein [uncultured Algibacter sp.]
MENENDIQARNEGQFIRLFNNVRRNTKLNAKSKMVLSHIISYQLQGKEFYMSNEGIGYEYGFSESTAARVVKLLEPYLNKRKEYVQLKKGEQVITIRYLSVKDLKKWVASSVINQNVVSPSEVIPNVIRPDVVDFTKTKTMNELLDLANTHFKNHGEFQSFVARNEAVYQHFQKLDLSKV